MFQVCLVYIWLLKSQDSDKSHDTEYNPAGLVGRGCRGGNVVSEPGVTEVDGVGPAPDTDPGHLLALHPGREGELQVLAGEAAQRRVRAGRVLNPHTGTAGSLRSSSRPHIEEGVRGLASVTAM